MLTMRFAPGTPSGSLLFYIRTAIQSFSNSLAFSKSITIFLPPSPSIFEQLFPVLATPSDGGGNKWFGVLAVTRPLEGVVPFTICFVHSGVVCVATKSRAVTLRKLRGL
jgi:hypothetical protein